MASYSSLEHREGQQDWEIKSDGSGNGSGAGFVAGSSTSVMSSLAGGSRYKAVVTDSEGYDQVSCRKLVLKSSLNLHPAGGQCKNKGINCTAADGEQYTHQSRPTPAYDSKHLTRR